MGKFVTCDWCKDPILPGELVAEGLHYFQYWEGQLAMHRDCYDLASDEHYSFDWYDQLIWEEWLNDQAVRKEPTND